MGSGYEFGAWDGQGLGFWASLWGLGLGLGLLVSTVYGFFGFGFGFRVWARACVQGSVSG